MSDDAIHFLQNDENKYDLIFIDAAKELYKELFELSLPHLNDGGLILVDDVFFQGDTLNDVPTSGKRCRCSQYA